jgi:hypothetical protein
MARQLQSDARPTPGAGIVNDDDAQQCCVARLISVA